MEYEVTVVTERIVKYVVNDMTREEILASRSLVGYPVWSDNENDFITEIIQIGD